VLREDLSPGELMADEIVTASSDLAPSVRRIMQAELDDDQKLRALTRFRNSLNQIGDPHRDPRYAIAHCDDPDE
jgi:hypothetical protein